MGFKVKNAPSEPQIINLEEWKAKRAKKIGSFQTTYMFDNKGRKRNVSVRDVESFKSQGWKEINESEFPNSGIPKVETSESESKSP